MSDLRFSVTPLEAKRLFQNLRSDAEALFNEIYVPSSSSQGTDTYKQELWEICESEFRKVYEMTRFALNVEGLQNYNDNINEFKLNCEDINGMEPLDSNLFAEYLKTQADLDETLRLYAESRKTIPQNSEASFQQHVFRMQTLFDGLDNEKINVPETPKIVDFKEFDRIAEILNYTNRNLRQHRKVLAYTN